MEIQKVKEWKENRNKQFKVIFGNAMIIYDVLRLKDNVSFIRGGNVCTKKFNGYIVDFHKDCIHVLVYSHDSIKSDKFEINDLLNARRPRRRVQAITKK